MHKYFAVLNSDAVNKYNWRFSIPALEGPMWQKGISGVPMHLGHDMHKPVGWSFPYGLYFQPGLTRSVGLAILPQTEEESKRIYVSKHNYMIAHVQKEIEEYGKDFLPHINDYTSEAKKFIAAGALSIVDEKIIQRIFPHLPGQIDKDNLLPLPVLLEEFTYRSQGVFIHKTKPLCVYVHPFFRRSLSRHNNFHFIFLDELMSHAANPKVTVRVAIDWDMIGYAPSYLEAQELEYWYGPKYNDDITAIIPGLARHQSSEPERNFYGISATEFYWKISKEKKYEFELEELKEEQAPLLPDTYACRYIHSIYNVADESFEHFDGAVRSYDGELYLERIGKKMTEFGRRSQYSKLFRIDGRLKLGDWKSLSTNYMQGNPLIYEYFGLEKPKMNYTLDATPTSVAEQLVPFSINQGEGVRVMVSYHEAKELPVESHVVSIYDLLSNGENNFSILEYDVVEVKKALNRLGKNLVWSEDVLLTVAEDQYWNIPCILHGAEQPQNDLDITLSALLNLFTALLKRQRERIVSFTVAWNMEGRETRVSVMGHIADLVNWIQLSAPIPTTHDKFIQWLNMQGKHLSNDKKVENPFKPLLDELAQFDGVLYMKRRVVAPKYNLDITSDDHGIHYSMEIPEAESELLELVNSGKIRPVMTCIVKKMGCSKTGGDYLLSPCSKILDSDIHTIVEEMDMMLMYWSDKPVH